MITFIRLIFLFRTLGAAQQLSMVAADYNMSIDNFGERDILARLPTSFGVAFFLDLFNSPLVEVCWCSPCDLGLLLTLFLVELLLLANL